MGLFDVGSRQPQPWSGRRNIIKKEHMFLKCNHLSAIIYSVEMKGIPECMKNIDHNAHSVYLLYYHLILVVKYRRKVFTDPVSNRAKDIFLYIAPN